MQHSSMFYLLCSSVFQIIYNGENLCQLHTYNDLYVTNPIERQVLIKNSLKAMVSNFPNPIAPLGRILAVCGAKAL